MKCSNPECDTNELGHDRYHDTDASAVVQWTEEFVLDHEFDTDSGKIGNILSGESGEMTADKGEQRPYIQTIQCKYCMEDLYSESLHTKVKKITPKDIRATFREMPYPESEINS